MNYLLEASLTYQKQGLSIFPCKMPTPQEVEDVRKHEGEEVAERFIKTNAKVPLTKWQEYQQERANEDQIRKWFSNCDPKRTAIAIVTGKISYLTVVDVDSKDLFPQIKELGLGSPLVSITGKGVHLFYDYDPRLKTTTEHLGIKGLDIRNDGGYIIAPPSPHYLGREYSFIDDFVSHTLSPPPEWLFKSTSAKKSKPINEGYLATEGKMVKIHQIQSALEIIPADDYDTWVKVGMALKHELGKQGLDIWREWSEKSEKYDPDEIDEKWDGFKEGHPQPVTAGTIIHLATEKGWEEKAVWPKPLPLPDNLRQVKPFEFDLLPDKLRPWAQDITERMQCPADFVAVGLMAGIGSLIGRKIGIRPQAQDDWTVTPNIWALVVGRPGVLKSPALEQALLPLKRLAAKANEEYHLAYANYEIAEVAASLRAQKAKKKAAKDLEKNPDLDLQSVLSVEKLAAPTLRRYLATDSTPEALGELLRLNPNGLLVHRDELVSLLKGLDREDRAEGRGFYLTGWNGDSSYTFDRIGRGMNLHIPAVCISMLGGTQPGRLAEYIRNAVNCGTADDGLIQRFGLLVWPDTEKDWKNVDRHPNEKAKREAYRIFEYLDTLDPLSVGAQQDLDSNGTPEGIPYLRFDDGGQKLFLEWRTDLECRLRTGDLHPAMESHLSKYRKLIPSLALIIHLSDNNSGPITKKAIIKALAWSEYLESHAQRAYGSVIHPEIESAKAILKHLHKGDLQNEFSNRDIYRNGWAHLGNREQTKAGLQQLVDYDWLQEERRTDTGGRHATIYILNPLGAL